MKIIQANKKGIELAVKYLKAGKAVVYPTDTAYGLGVDASNPTAIRRLIRIKKRPNQPIHVIAQNLTAVKKLAIVDKLAKKLFKKLMPGPVTLVLPTLPPLNLPLSACGGQGEKRRGELPLPSGRGRKGEGFSSPPVRTRIGGDREGVDSIDILSAGTGTIGIRLPDNKIALALVKKLGRPITTPSANPHRGPTPYSVQDSYDQFRNKRYQPDLYLDAGKLPKVKPSTIISIENRELKILRKGPISKKQILKILPSS